MSAMSDMNIESNHVMDLYIKYINYDNVFDGQYDEIDNEDMRWTFIDAAVKLLEQLTDRNVDDEIVK